jgi:hypothetical protein
MVFCVPNFVGIADVSSLDSMTLEMHFSIYFHNIFLLPYVKFSFINLLFTADGISKPRNIVYAVWVSKDLLQALQCECVLTECW